jgi:uncharacterized protein YcfJ
MKSTNILVAALAMSIIAMPLSAGHRNHQDKLVFKDRARVVDVEPIIEVVTIPSERRECWTEEVTSNGGRDRSDAGMIVGSIIGGVAGHQVGRGNGKKVATVGGTILGAVIGNNMGKDYRRSPRVRVEERCQIIDESYQEERIDGYWVTMKYRGETFTQRMEEEPGKFVRVRVAVKALER